VNAVVSYRFSLENHPSEVWRILWLYHDLVHRDQIFTFRIVHVYIGIDGCVGEFQQ